MLFHSKHIQICYVENMSLHPIAAHFHGHSKIVLKKITGETSDNILQVILFWQSYYQLELTIWSWVIILYGIHISSTKCVFHSFIHSLFI